MPEYLPPDLYDQDPDDDEPVGEPVEQVVEPDAQASEAPTPGTDLVRRPPSGVAPVGRAQCVQTGPLTRAALAQHLCNAVLTRVMFAPNSRALLNLGRAVRTVTPAQRRVLTARDKGCVIPSCLVPATGCQAHHVRWWRHGGGTDLENLVLICTHHHSAVHTGVWKLAVIDHVPWAIPS